MAKLKVKKSYYYRGQQLHHYGEIGDCNIFTTEDRQTLIIANSQNPESKYLVFCSASEINSITRKPF